MQQLLLLLLPMMMVMAGDGCNDGSGDIRRIRRDACSGGRFGSNSFASHTHSLPLSLALSITADRWGEGEMTREVGDRPSSRCGVNFI